VRSSEVSAFGLSPVSLHYLINLDLEAGVKYHCQSSILLFIVSFFSSNFPQAV